MKNTKGIRNCISRVIAFALAFMLCIDCVPVSAASYRIIADRLTYKDGKYAIEQTSRGDIVYDMDGNVVISPGRYCRIEYLGGDLFAVNKVYEHTNLEKVFTQSKEMSYPYIYNIKKNTETKVSLNFQNNNPAQDAKIYPFYNGYAKVENAAYYMWTSMTYYQFIDKKGKTIMNEQPYTYCSDMFKVNDKLYFFTKGDELSMSSGADKDSLRKISKRDINGKAVKTITLPKGYGLDLALVKNGKKFFLKVTMTASGSTEYRLYNTDLKQVKKYSQDQIKEMKEFDPIGTEKKNGTSGDYQSPEVDNKFILERNWAIITPYTTEATAFDVAGASNDEGAWVMLWDSKAEGEKFGNFTSYTLKRSESNQAYMFEKVGTDKYRIWAGHSGRQLKSYYDKDSNVTRLVQGSYSDKDSKGKEIKEQIFTIVQNSDNSFYIKNCDGKYLTMSYGKTEANTQLVFADFANGDSKQKFKAGMISIYNIYD